MIKTAWVIDDHKLFNAGLSRLMLTLEEIDEVDSFDNPDSALAQNKQGTDLCLIVADYFMPGFKIEKWLPIIRQRFHNTPIVIISSSISRVDRTKCFSLGADAYYEKHSEPTEVLNGLQQILSTNYHKKNAGIKQAPHDHSNQNITQKLANSNLTQRQIDVLICLARGHSTKSIATELNVSSETIKSHTSQIYRKLNVNNRESACLWARENGLI